MQSWVWIIFQPLLDLLSIASLARGALLGDNGAEMGGPR